MTLTPLKFAADRELGKVCLHEMPEAIGRWTSKRKAQVVTAVHGGLLTMAEACARYALTEEEFVSWSMAMTTHGLRGLQENQLMQRRHPAAL